MKFNPFPVIHTKRLVLRRTTHADAPVLYELRTNEDVMRHINRPRPGSLDDIIALIDKIAGMTAANEGIQWAISMPGDDTCLGSVGYHKITPEEFRAEVGYMLHPAMQGKGIMAEALAAAIDYGFREMGLHIIDAIVNPANLKSQAVLDRFGFERCGTLEDGYWEYMLRSPFVKA